MSASTITLANFFNNLLVYLFHFHNSFPIYCNNNQIMTESQARQKRRAKLTQVKLTLDARSYARSILARHIDPIVSTGEFIRACVTFKCLGWSVLDEGIFRRALWTHTVDKVYFAFIINSVSELLVTECIVSSIVRVLVLA